MTASLISATLYRENERIEPKEVADQRHLSLLVTYKTYKGFTSWLLLFWFTLSIVRGLDHLQVRKALHLGGGNLPQSCMQPRDDSEAVNRTDYHEHVLGLVDRSE